MAGQTRTRKRPNDLSRSSVESRPRIKLDEVAPLFMTIELELDSNLDRILIRMSSNQGSRSLGQTPTSLGQLNLNQSFEDIIRIAKNSRRMPKSSFRSIANTGYDLYSRLFGDSGAIGELIINHIENDVIGLSKSEEIQFKTGAISPARILVVTNGINIPWELLYARNPSDFDFDGAPGEIDPDYFLGSCFVFQKHLTLKKERGSFERRIASTQGISVFADNKLNHALKIEVPAIQAIFSSDGRRFDFPDAIKTRDPQGNEIETVDYLLAEKMNLVTEPIVHFACDAVIENGTTKIRISDNYYQYERPFNRELLPSKGGSYVFLNACELALSKCFEKCGLVNAFLEKGYLGVIATEIPVSDEQASTFAQLVYTYFLNYQNRSLLSAVFLARRKLLENEESLVGFTYATYGAWDIVRT